MVAWPLVPQISRLRFTAFFVKIIVYQFHGSMIKYAFFSQFTYGTMSNPDMIKTMLINLPLTMMRMTTMTAATTMMMTRRWTSRTRKRTKRMRIILVMVMMMTVLLVPHLWSSEEFSVTNDDHFVGHINSQFLEFLEVFNSTIIRIDQFALFEQESHILREDWRFLN